MRTLLPVQRFAALRTVAGRARSVAGRAVLGVLALLAANALIPTSAMAHGLVGRAYLPVPTWLFAWAAGIVLIVSFILLPRLWTTPRLEASTERRVMTLPGWLSALCGALGLAAFLAVIVSGIAGSQLPSANLAPTAVFVIFWVAVPIVSVLLGDVFAAFNPWRAAARAVRFAYRRARRADPPQPLLYPEWLGRWPAVAGIVVFAWVELVFVGRQHPATLAILATAYALTQLVGMALFGIECWTERGDAFAVAFNLFARLAPLHVRDGALWRRAPLAGTTTLHSEIPGTTWLLCTLIGATTFDGFMNGPVWRSFAPSLQRAVRHVGIMGSAALELAATLGLLACVLLCAGLYQLGVRGMRTVSPRRQVRQLATAFCHSLAPIAFAYLLAHYFSLLVTQGQATAFLISDPLGTGANLFGTAGAKIDYGVVSAAVIWYVQVLALITGHVGGLMLAHDRALVVYRDQRAAADSQRWMLVVMVSFTCLGLWLLSAVNT